MSTNRKRPTGDYPVGYCRPPKASQFRKGESGNPTGRRKRPSDQAIETIFRRLAEEKIIVVIDGRERSITKMEAILRRSLNDMLGGSPSERRAATKLYIELGWFAPVPEDKRPNSNSIVQFVEHLRQAAEHVDRKEDGKPADPTKPAD